MSKKCPFCGEPCVGFSSMCEKHRDEWAKTCGGSTDTGVTIRWAAKKAKQYARAQWRKELKFIKARWAKLNEIPERFL